MIMKNGTDRTLGNNGIAYRPPKKRHGAWDITLPEASDML